jgi:hypothetical protein
MRLYNLHKPEEPTPITMDQLREVVYLREKCLARFAKPVT